MSASLINEGKIRSCISRHALEAPPKRERSFNPKNEQSSASKVITLQGALGGAAHWSSLFQFYVWIGGTLRCVAEIEG